MGTNFYIRGHLREDSPEWHIGKRSAAGPYCWDCEVTLCEDGESAIHYGKSKWHDTCPRCGKAMVNESLSKGAIARELGFDKSQPKRKTGVASCCSFSWAMTKIEFQDKVEHWDGLCPCCGQKYPNQDKPIENEYGDTFTLEEFVNILSECPIQFFDNIGQTFS